MPRKKRENSKILYLRICFWDRVWGLSFGPIFLFQNLDVIRKIPKMGGFDVLTKKH